jgi:hypothetical protein
MSDSTTHATRLLAAAAYRGKPDVRPWLLKWLADPNRAVPPEVGVDLSLVARVAQFSDKREKAYNYLFLALGLAALAMLAAGLPAAIMLLIVVASAVWFQKDAEQRHVLIERFGRQRYSPKDVEQQFTAPLDARRADAIPSAHANVTVYSGFSPFVGAGLDFGGWSFAIATDKAKRDFGSMPPARFHLRDLYRDVSEAVERLDLPGLEQQDHFFIQGSDVRGDESLLADHYGRPDKVLSPRVAERYAYGSDARVRHYRWIRVCDWTGDIVVSYFLRCSLRGPMLFVEVKRFLLTPLKASLRDIDNVAPLRTMETLGRLFLIAPIAGAFNLFAAPFAVLGYLTEAWDQFWGTTERERHRLIDANPLWDYGASTSVRQTFASGEYVRYFQRADSDYYEKALEKEILAALIDFLDARGIDTSDLRERQSTILNNGVIVQGGNIAAGSLAVGDGARAVQQKITNVAKRVGVQGAERGAA